ncbi:MAG: hypothetical protein NNA22_08800 [Nitrospira sp.]|nr:hypothetical protein [Nitrospira sp.]
MFGSQALEIALSLSLIYLQLSLVCSVLNEWMAGFLNMRAKNLWEGVRNLLYDAEGSGLARQLYDHPLVKHLGRAGRLPSYIPSRVFAMALFDVVAPLEESSKTQTLTAVRASVAALSNEPVKRVLLNLIDEAGDDLKRARENVERWYDDAMDRVSGWYKKRAQSLIFVWALAVTLAVNADTILIVNTLTHDATMRASLVAIAEAKAKEALPPDAQQTAELIEQMSAETKKLGFPIGWTREPGLPTSFPEEVGAWALKVVGLFLTTGAVSLGAPFWFDVLNKLVNIRSVGKKPERSQQQKELS